MFKEGDMISSYDLDKIEKQTNTTIRRYGELKEHVHVVSVLAPNYLATLILTAYSPTSGVMTYKVVYVV